MDRRALGSAAYRWWDRKHHRYRPSGRWRRSLHRAAAGLFAFGATLVGVAAVVASIGPAHERVGAHTITTSWYYAVIFGSLAGVLCVVVGVCAAWAIDTSDIPPNHWKTLLAALEEVEGNIKCGEACRDAAGQKNELGREFLLRHYKKLNLAKRWDRVVGAAEDARVPVRDRTRTEVGCRLTAPEYAADAIAKGIAAQINMRITAGNAGMPLGFRWNRDWDAGTVTEGPEEPPEIWITLAPLPGETEAEWWDRGADLRSEVERLAADVWSWRESTDCVAAWRLREQRQVELLHEIRFIHEQWPPPRTSGCRGCS